MSKRLLLATVLVLAAAFWTSTSAQLIRSSSPKDKSIEDKYRSDEIERVRRDALTPEYRPTTTRFPQIKEDFERIQIINSELFEATASYSRLDYEQVSEAAGEIRKRATRLKSNLFPAESKDRPKQSGQQTAAREDLKFLLTELDKAIGSFVHNPMFENTKVVNPQDSTRAEQELQKIINLCARARKKAQEKVSQKD